MKDRLINTLMLIVLFCAVLSLASCKSKSKEKNDSDTSKTDPVLSKVEAERAPTNEELEDFATAEARNMHFAYNKFIESHPTSPLVLKAYEKLKKFGSLTAKEDILIPIADLTSKYHWNSQTVLWKWGNDLSGVQMSGGSVMLLSEKTVNPIYGVPFAFGFEGYCFGNICFGNLQIQGRCTFESEGLRLQKDTILFYPL